MILELLIGSLPKDASLNDAVDLQKEFKVQTIPDAMSVVLFLQKIKTASILKHQQMFNGFDLEIMEEVVSRMKKVAKEEVIYSLDVPQFEPTLAPKCAEIIKEIKYSGAKAMLHCCGNFDIESALWTEPDILSYDEVHHPKLKEIYEKQILESGVDIAIGLVDPAHINAKEETVFKFLDQIKYITPCCGLRGYDLKTCYQVMSELAYYHYINC